MSDTILLTSSDSILYILKGTDSTTITLFSVKPTANLVKVVCSEKGEGHRKVENAIMQCGPNLLRLKFQNFYFADFFSVHSTSPTNAR